MFEIALTNTAFPDTSGLAATFAQIKEARAPDPSTGHQFDFFNTRVVQSKGFFHPYTVGYLANGVGCVHVTTFPLNDDSLKNLNSFLAAFDDANVNLHGVTRSKLWMIKAHLFLIYFVDYRIHDCNPSVFSVYVFYFEAFAKRSFRPNSALCSKFYPRDINYMHVVKFLAWFDFERKS